MLAAVAWIVHPAAGLALGLFSVVLFSRRGQPWTAVAFASALLLLLAVLGAGWVAHPAAGMLLGYFGATAFGHWQRRWPALLAALVALNLRIKEALAQLHGLGQQGSESGYLARAIREEYVPTAVNGYLKLPSTRADSVPIEGDRTGRDLLREQLDLLLDAVQDILDTTLRAGARELLTHQRFLEDCFGRSADTTPSGELKV